MNNYETAKKFFETTKFYKTGRSPLTNGGETYVKMNILKELNEKFGFKFEDMYLEFPVKMGSAGSKAKFIDVVIMSKHKPEVLLEVKDGMDSKNVLQEIETQLFNLAPAVAAKDIKFLVHASGDEFGKMLFRTINYKAYSNYEEWIDGGEQETPLAGVSGYASTGIRNTEADNNRLAQMNEESLTAAFKKIINNLWQGGKLNEEQYFDEFIKILIAKIYDELSTNVGDEYKFQTSLVKNPYDILNSLYHEGAKIFGIEANEIKDINKTIPKDIYAVVIETLQNYLISKSALDDDVLGNVFESILTKSYKQAKGQFFTNAKLVVFIAQTLQLKQMAAQIWKEEERPIKVIDPSSGSGSFLTFTAKHISDFYTSLKDNKNLSVIAKSKVSSFFSDGRRNWADGNIIGIETSEKLTSVQKVNFAMHKLSSLNVKYNNALVSISELGFKAKKLSFYPCDVNGEFDAVVTNPPFSLNISVDPKNFVLSNEKSHYLFIERWYQLLKEGGRVSAVLPESTFDGQSNVFPKIFMHIFFKTHALTSLGQQAFMPFTGTKTSIWNAVKRRDSDVIVKLEQYNSCLDEAKEIAKRFKSGDHSEIKKYYFADEEELEKLAKNKKHQFFGNGPHNLALIIFMKKYLNENIVYSNPENNIGYKKTTRGELKVKNDLLPILDELKWYPFDGEPNNVINTDVKALTRLIKINSIHPFMGGRFDYNAASLFKSKETLSDLLVRKDVKIDIDSLDGEIKYVQIGDVDNYGMITSYNTINIDNILEAKRENLKTLDQFEKFLKEKEIEDPVIIAIYKKVFKGDIIKPQIGDILISKTRPLLRKNHLVRNEEYYFTSGFFPFGTIASSPEAVWKHIQSDRKKMNKIARNSGTYPTLTIGDILEAPIAKAKLNVLIENKEIYTKDVHDSLTKIDQLKNQTDLIIKGLFGNE